MRRGSDAGRGGRIRLLEMNLKEKSRRPVGRIKIGL
jgi:hypothetical protein